MMKEDETAPRPYKAYGTKSDPKLDISGGLKIIINLLQRERP
jgi:hypothetical protein